MWTSLRSPALTSEVRRARALPFMHMLSILHALPLSQHSHHPSASGDELTHITDLFFYITDIETLEIWHENDGIDWNTSRWKLHKAVVTCLQSSLHSDSPSRGGKGDHAQRTTKTTDSAQWHFVPKEPWLGCVPESTVDLERKLQMAREEQVRVQLIGHARNNM